MPAYTITLQFLTGNEWRFTGANTVHDNRKFDFNFIKSIFSNYKLGREKPLPNVTTLQN